MKTKKVRELMVPLEEYATVSEEATLREAIVNLEQAQHNFDQSRYRHRAILVYNQDGKIVGKVSQHDILTALEPKYQELFPKQGRLSRLGFSTAFTKSLLENYNLWRAPFLEICQKAAKMKVKTFMYTPEEGEYVAADAELGAAIHQLVVGHHQSLLVTENQEIVGILRLTDVFMCVYDAVVSCEAE